MLRYQQVWRQVAAVEKCAAILAKIQECRLDAGIDFGHSAQVNGPVWWF